MRARAAAGMMAIVVGAGCSLGQGTGDITSGALFAHDCWGSVTNGVARGDGYDMQPTFFAANPYQNTLLLRVQRGNDLEEVSDGLDVVIDDIAKIRASIVAAADGGAAGASGTSSGTGGGTSIGTRGETVYQVAVPVGVAVPGSPTVPPADQLANPSIVHMSLYLHRSCHNQNTVLEAVSGTAQFAALFSGDPNEEAAAQKLTDATFDIQVGDMADVPLGKYPRDIPADLQSRVTGSFRFYFERGQPGQPFP